ncbi:Glycogenin-1 [Nakaseomyces bracarensis]|uniref:Glycogenin-1 n=1 Tax=Nakaseomyces bracarensis TaxID=273131 RepID=A0ABR4P0N9_9SACH
MKNVGIVTLLYSADYLPGVFTLGYKVRKLLEASGRDIKLCLMVTRTLYNDILSDIAKNLLGCLFDEIVQVDPLDYQYVTQDRNSGNLQMLDRPELSFALIKARLWELTQYEQILYLDADTLPMNTGLFDLFEILGDQTKEQIAAVPDIGWPDIFNSGVMMIVPDKDINVELRNYILNVVSIDGSDQGILNQFFNQNTRLNEFGRIANYVTREWIRLPFLYNVTTPNYGYECPPAMKFFGPHIRLIHFIGKHKPWSKWSQEEFKKSQYAAQWRATYLDFQIDYDIVELLADTTIDTGHHEEEQHHHHDEHDEHRHHQEQHEEHHDEHDHHEQHQDYKEECHEERLDSIPENEECEKEEENYEPEQPKPPTPIPLPLDFKEWLTTFITKEDEPEQPPQPPAEEHQYHEEYHTQEFPAANVGESSRDDHVPAVEKSVPHRRPITIEHDDHFGPKIVRSSDKKIRFIEEEEVLDHELDDVIHDEDEQVTDEDDDELQDRTNEAKERELAGELEVEDQDDDLEEYHRHVPQTNYKFEWEGSNYLKRVERSFPDDIFEYSVE